MILFITVLLILTLIILKLYVKLTTGWCRSSVNLLGKTVIVTGANTGIGYETALDMAMRGAKLILACRNKTKAFEARDKIIKATNNPNIFIQIVDMTSFKSVRNFADEINRSEDRLDILINNAGVGHLFDSKTADGCQTTIQTNYYSPVLLTLLLLNLLRKTPDSRVVNVSSLTAKYAKFDLENLETAIYSPYAKSKLYNILFTIELAKRLKNSSVTTYSLHPGVIQTEIIRNMPYILRIITDFLLQHIFKSAKEGAQTQIYCAVEKGIESLSGEHFEDCARVPRYSSINLDDAPKLWRKTLEIIKVNPDIKYE